MAEKTIRISGLNETVRAFRKLEKSVAREIQQELKKAVEPVVTDAKSRISRYSGARIAQIGPRASGASVYVTQRAKKVTGLRGDFGRLQQRHFEEALEAEAHNVRKNVEGALDKLTRSEGF